MYAQRNAQQDGTASRPATSAPITVSSTSPFPPCFSPPSCSIGILTGDLDGSSAVGGGSSADLSGGKSHGIRSPSETDIPRSRTSDARAEFPPVLVTSPTSVQHLHDRTTGAQCAPPLLQSKLRSRVQWILMDALCEQWMRS